MSAASPVVTESSAIEKAFREHERHWSSAGWNGSPDPGNWRNIRPMCMCQQRLVDGTHWSTSQVREAHQAHLIAAILWELSEVSR